MRQIVKRSLSWLLTFCMVLTLLPITSMEVKAETTQRVTPLDCSAFTKDESNPEEGWSWNHTTKTLTLENFNLVTSDAQGVTTPAVATKIVLKGSNQIISSSTSNTASAIYASAKLTIEEEEGESGSLLCRAEGMGIRSMGSSDVVINSGTITCNSISETAMNLSGIDTRNTVIVNGGTLITTSASSSGIRTKYGLKLFGGKVISSGVDKAIYVEDASFGGVFGIGETMYRYRTSENGEWTTATPFSDEWTVHNELNNVAVNNPYVELEPVQLGLKEKIEMAGFTATYNDDETVLAVTGPSNISKNLELTIPEGVTVDWQANLTGVSGGNAIKILADSNATSVFKASGAIKAGNTGYAIYNAGPGSVVVGGTVSGYSSGSGSPCGGIYAAKTAGDIIVLSGGTINGGSGTTSYAINTASGYNGNIHIAGTINLGTGATNNYGVYLDGTGTGTLAMDTANVVGTAVNSQACYLNNQSQNHRIEDSSISSGVMASIVDDANKGKDAPPAITLGANAGLEIVGSTLEVAGAKGIKSTGTLNITGSTILVKGDGSLTETDIWCVSTTAGSVTATDSQLISWFGKSFYTAGSGSYYLRGNTATLSRVITEAPVERDADTVVIIWFLIDHKVYEYVEGTSTNLDARNSAVAKYAVDNNGKSGVSYQLGGNSGFIDVTGRVSVQDWYTPITDANFTVNWNEEKTVLTVTGSRTLAANLTLGIPEGITVDWQATSTGAAIELLSGCDASSVFKVSGTGKITGGSGTTTYGIINNSTATVEVSDGGKVNGGNGTDNRYGIWLKTGISSKVVVDNGTVEAGSGTSKNSTAILIPVNTQTLLTVTNDSVIHGGDGSVSSIGISYGSTNENSLIKDSTINEGGLGTGAALYVPYYAAVNPVLTIEDSTIKTDGVTGVINGGTLMVDNCRIDVMINSSSASGIKNLAGASVDTTVIDSQVVAKMGRAFSGDASNIMKVQGNTVGLCASHLIDASVSRESNVITFTWYPNKLEFAAGSSEDLMRSGFEPKPATTILKWATDKQENSGIYYEYETNIGFLDMEIYNVVVPSFAKVIKDAGFHTAWNDDGDILTVTNTEANPNGTVASGLSLSIPDGVTVDWQAVISATTGTAIEIAAGSAADSVFKVSNGGSITGGSNSGYGINVKANGVTIEVNEDCTVSGGTGDDATVGINVVEDVSGASVIVDGGTVTGGTSTEGARAICILTGTLTSLIVKNGAVIDGGNVPADRWGHAIRYDSSNENSIIKDSTLIGKGKYGHALVYEGGDLLTVRNCDVTANIETANSDLDIDNCTIRVLSNSSDACGIYSNEGTVNVNDSIVIARYGIPFNNTRETGIMNLTGKTVGFGKKDSVDITSQTADVILIKWSGADATEYTKKASSDLTVTPADAAVKWGMNLEEKAGLSYLKGSNSGFLDLNEYVTIFDLEKQIIDAGFSANWNEDETILTVTGENKSASTLNLSLPGGITIDWQAEMVAETGNAIVIESGSAADSVFKVNMSGSITGGSGTSDTNCGILSKGEGVTIEVRNGMVFGGSGNESCAIKINTGVSGKIILDRAVVSGGTGEQRSQAIFVQGGTATLLDIQNCMIDGGTGTTSCGIDFYGSDVASKMVNSTISAARGHFGYIYNGDGTFEFKNCNVTVLTCDGIFNDGGTLTVDTCTIKVGNDAASFGVTDYDGVTTVIDTTVIARYGRAFELLGSTPTLNLEGKTVGFGKSESTYSAKEADVILIEWSGADGTEYERNSTTDLTVTPAGATAKWVENAQDKTGVAYEKGSNTGFIDLDKYASIPNIAKKIRDAGFSASWNGDETVLTVTGENTSASTLTLVLPENITVDWQAEMEVESGAAIIIAADSATDSIFKVSNGGIISGGKNDGAVGGSAGIRNLGNGTIRVDIEGTVNGGNDTPSVGIIQAENTSGKVIINEGTVTGGTDMMPVAIKIEGSDALLQITGGKIDGGSGSIGSDGILNKSSNENNIITGNSIIIGGMGNDFSAIANTVDAKLLIENSTIINIGTGESVFNRGTVTIKDSLVVARYGTAFNNQSGELYLTGNTVGFGAEDSTYTSKEADVILIKWSGADGTEYTKGTTTDLTVTPAGATVKWAENAEEKTGVSYEKGSNIGFIDLDEYASIPNIAKIIRDAGFSASWNGDETVLTVTGENTSASTLTLSLPEGVTIDWQAKMGVTSGSAIIIAADSAADSIFKVRGGGSITGGGGNSLNCGILSAAAGVVIEVGENGVVSGGSGSASCGIAMETEISGTIIVNGGTVNGGSGSGYSEAINIPSNTTTLLDVKNHSVINGGSSNTSYGISCYSANAASKIEDSTLTGGHGNGYAFYYDNAAAFTIKNTEIIAQGNSGILNEGTLTIDGCTINVEGTSGTASGVATAGGVTTVVDTISIARYGSAFLKDNGTLNLTGKTVGFGKADSTFTMKEADVILAKWSGENDDEYVEGSTLDLTVEPEDATVKWVYENSKSGMSYNKGTNTGFLNLNDYVIVTSVAKTIEEAGFTVSWNEAKTILTVTNKTGVTPTDGLILTIPEGVTIDWRATLAVDEGAAITIDSESDATSVFQVNTGGNITGGGGTNSYGILNNGAGTVKVIAGKVNGGNGSTSYGIFIPDESTSLLVTTGGTIEGGTGSTSYGIYNGSTNASNKIENTAVVGGNGNGFVIRMNTGSVLEIKGSTIAGVGTRGIYNYEATLIVDKSIITVTGTGASPYGIASVDGTTEVTDSTVIVRHGKAFIVNGGALNLNGNTVGLGSADSTYTNKGNDVVLINWSGNDADEYLEGNKNNLTVTPTGATAVWAVQNNKSGISYSKGNNNGFLDLNNHVTVIKIYKVTYQGNGSTSGTVPTGSGTSYRTGTRVTVLGNTGNLAKTGYSFAGWNTKSDGSGTNYAAGSTLTISADTILYAKWTYNYVSVTNITGVPTKGTVGTTLTLNGTVAPSKAEKKTITWSIVSKGNTKAKLSGNKLTFVEAGTVKVRATVKDGTAKGTDYKKDFTITVKYGVAKGNTYTVSGLTYKATLVDNSGKKGVEVSVTGLAKNNKNAKTVTVPKTVKIKGATCKVTSIGDKAFKNNTKLKKITIGDNVKTIGISAFIYCSSLETVSIGTGLTEIKTHAFCYDKKIKTFTIKSKNLKKIGAPHTFNQVKGTLKVPSSKLSAYKKLFKNQKGTEGITFKKI